MKDYGLPISLWDSYRLGVRTVSRWPSTWSGRARRLGGLLKYPPNLVNWLTPIDFVRFREFEFAFDAIRRYHPEPRRVLDLSSPKLLPLTVAHRFPAAEVRSTDIVDEEVRQVAEAANHLHLPNLTAEIKDARALDFPDASFDLVTSVSVFEHIAPEADGDIPAARELGRVLAPGGIAILTVPFSRTYFAEYREGQVYERAAGESERNFFQRFYDSERLQRTVIEPSGLEAVSLTFIEERLYSQDPHRRVAHRVNSTGRQKMVYGPWFFPLSRIFLSAPKPLDDCRKPYIACLVLRKPA